MWNFENHTWWDSSEDEKNYGDFTTWLPQWLGLDLTEGDPKLQVVVKKNPTKGDDVLKYFLASQQEIRFRVTTHIHFRIESIWHQNCIDSNM